MNPEAAGTVYPDVEFSVDPARVASFRELFGQGRGIPPTFLTAAEFAVFPRVVGDPGLELDFSRVVHGSESFRYRRPLVDGESLTVRARIESIKVRSGAGFLTVVMEMFGSDGKLAATATSTMIERGAG